MALFGRSADKALAASLLAAASGAAIMVVAPMLYLRTPLAQGRGRAVDQPVLFDHRQHVRDARIDCRFCHSLVERSSRAGMPSVQLCMGCHAQVLTRSPLLDPLRRGLATGEVLAWKRAERLPGFVYFHHAAHLGAGVGCQECHGHVEDRYVAAQEAPLTMAWCLECHRKPGGGRERLVTCTACHR